MDVNVSLKPHVVKSLRVLPALLTSPLSEELETHLQSSTIPYPILLNISKWSRTTDGKSALKNHNLDMRSYEMISLLAGSVTSPDRKFPPQQRPRSHEETKTQELNDRKAVTAVVNSLLSIGGAGVAAWWATGAAGWKDEWKALFAILVAAVVAIAEGVLFFIWDSRRNPGHRRVQTALHKKDQDNSQEVLVEPANRLGLVRRRVLRPE